MKCYYLLLVLILFCACKKTLTITKTVQKLNSLKKENDWSPSLDAMIVIRQKK